MNPVAIRVRFAPSPTGPLHVGGVRTALFNWLFARKRGGAFVLRIEDTDMSRSAAEYEKDIVEGFRWLGLDWDEGPADGDSKGSYGPYRQSERSEVYARHADTLLSSGAAYYCFCSKELLEEKRQARLADGLPPKYNGHCRELSRDEAAARRARGEHAIIRFKVPDAGVKFTDLIRGEIAFDMGAVGDFSIAKSAREPLYNFSAAVDDYEMRISHVIRGEEHLANTPKQLLMQKALGFPHPHYAHLPLILNPDRSKMSKRFADTALREYRSAGFLPDALLNFLALLGWHPADNRELFSRKELIEAFDIGRVQKAGAVFQTDKLEWMNGQYVKAMNDEALAGVLRAEGFVQGVMSDHALMGAVHLVRDRLKKLGDFEEAAAFVFRRLPYTAELLKWKDESAAKTAECLRSAHALLAAVPESAFVTHTLEETLRPLVQERGRGTVLWPVRVAVSGREASPGPYEIMEALGKDESLQRIDDAIKRLEQHA